MFIETDSREGSPFVIIPCSFSSGVLFFRIFFVPLCPKDRYM